MDIAVTNNSKPQHIIRKRESLQIKISTLFSPFKYFWLDFGEISKRKVSTSLEIELNIGLDVHFPCFLVVRTVSQIRCKCQRKDSIDSFIEVCQRNMLSATLSSGHQSYLTALCIIHGFGGNNYVPFEKRETAGNYSILVLQHMTQFHICIYIYIFDNVFFVINLMSINVSLKNEISRYFCVFEWIIVYT